jgi:four helix bundle protein
MKENNLVRDKSYEFALRIVKLYRYLTEKKKENLLSKQLLKSGTSIGANVEEAIGAQTKADFTCKLAIAYKEARETHYWLRIIRDSGLLTAKQAGSIINDLDQLLKIIAKIQITLKGKMP